ncbi:Hypothetical protein EIN_318220, partial [Entamoeba invadens IP1]
MLTHTQPIQHRRDENQFNPYDNNEGTSLALKGK